MKTGDCLLQGDRCKEELGAKNTSQMNLLIDDHFRFCHPDNAGSYGYERDGDLYTVCS